MSRKGSFNRQPSTFRQKENVDDVGYIQNRDSSGGEIISSKRGRVVKKV